MTPHQFLLLKVLQSKQINDSGSNVDMVEILAENIMENGDKRLDMVTLKVPNGEPYRKAVGHAVSVPVGAFVAEGKIAYYVLKNENPKLLPA